MKRKRSRRTGRGVGGRRKRGRIEERSTDRERGVGGKRKRNRKWKIEERCSRAEERKRSRRIEEK